MIGIVILTLLALILSLILVTLEQKLNKKTPTVEKICELLPGYNCGACGFGSCEGMARTMLENLENYKKCKPLRGAALKEMEEFAKNN